MGVNNLIEIFNEKYYDHLSGGILEAFGKLFYKNLRIFLYPMKNDKSGEIINSNNLHVEPRMKNLTNSLSLTARLLTFLDLIKPF